MKLFVVAAIVALLAANSSLAASDCANKAVEKKLSGAAKTSFITKCEADTKATPSACEDRASEKKLAGAARTSFVKKCEKDAIAGR